MSVGSGGRLEGPPCANLVLIFVNTNNTKNTNNHKKTEHGILLKIQHKLLLLVLRGCLDRERWRERKIGERER